MKARTLFILGAILIAAASRCLPHPANFWPMTAMALFGAATLRDRKLALLVPLLSLLASDVAIEVLHRQGWIETWGFYPASWGVYAAMLAVTILGFVLQRHRSAPWIAGTALVGGILYWLIVDFAWWTSMGLDPLTPAGLLSCYAKGFPFFVRKLVGDAFYVTVLFGGLALFQAWLPALREEAPAILAEPVAVQ